MKIQIGEQIRAQRKAHHMMQEQLAEALGVSVAAVSKWERGAAVPELRYIVEMADLFGISMDVLVGYQVQSGTAAELEDRISTLQRRKDFNEAAAEAEKALVRYPNHFPIVYRSGELYEVMGIETDDREAVERAIQLLNHAVLLLPQNENPEIDEYTIQNQIAMCCIYLGRTDEGIALLKKYNAGGIHDALIGMTYAASEAHDPQEATEYLMRAFLNTLTALTRTMIGYVNYFTRLERFEEAFDAALWMAGYLETVKIDRHTITYLDKLLAPLYGECAWLADRLGKPTDADFYLQEAFRLAKYFDAAPVYDVGNIRFCIGDVSKLTAYDDIGRSVMEVVEQKLGGRDMSKGLQEAWEKVRAAEREGGE